MHACKGVRMYTSVSKTRGKADVHSEVEAREANSMRLSSKLVRMGATAARATENITYLKDRLHQHTFYRASENPLNEPRHQKAIDRYT
jgi:hypothetical protein